MASTLSFLTDNGSSSSVRRHWISVILLSSLLTMDNTNILMIQASSDLSIYSLDSSLISSSTTLNDSTFQLFSAENMSSYGDIMYRINLPSIHNVTNSKSILTISSVDSSSASFLFEINTPKEIHKPTLSEAILFGFLGVTVTNMCALMGLLCIPLKHRKCYPILMAFMISLAAGALMSTAVMVLIPEAIRMVDMPAEFGGQGRSYLWKMFCILGGTIAFYCLEYLIFIFPKCFKRDINQMRPGNGDMPEVPITGGHGHSHGAHGHSHNISVFNITPEENSQSKQSHSSDSDVDDIIIEVNSCCSKWCKFNKLQFYNVAPVAWMILIGDGCHNFMDGLTIGAGFSKSPVIGLTLSLSILFEELPHELGDFAILLSSGLSVKAALACNVLSACSAYLGLIIGLVIGEVPSGALYVFAITAGIFMYISLSDMLPQLRANIEDADARTGKSLNTFLLQLSGLLVGCACVIGVTVSSDYIVF